MPLRDIVVTAAIFLLLPACFARPWIGVLVWSWIGYMNPHRLTWGFAYGMPFAMIVGLATLTGLLVTRDRRLPPNTIQVWLMLALWVLFAVTTLTAMFPDDARDQFDKVSKILIMVFVTLMVFQDAKRVRALIWVAALSIGFFGLKGGIWALTSGGQNMVLGPPGSFLAGNTEIGLGLNMALPLLLFVRQDAPYRWLRHFMTFWIAMTVVAVIFTYSRGALLGLAVVGAMLVLKSRARIMFLLLMVAAYFTAPAVLPERWLNRMDTIQTYEADRSAMGRIEAWGLAIRIANSHPLLGAGFRPFKPIVYQTYSYEQTTSSRDAHSIFFQVLAEHGYTGLLLYLALILSTFLGLRSVRRHAARDPSKEWMVRCTRMLDVSLCGYIAAGAFLSLSYFDLFYHLVAITAILQVLVRQPAEAPAEPAPALATRALRPLRAR